MKPFQLLLGSAIMLWMMPTFAEEVDLHSQAKRHVDFKQRVAASVTQQAAVLSGQVNSSVGIKHIPVTVQATDPNNYNRQNAQAPTYQSRDSHHGRHQSGFSRTRQTHPIHNTHFNMTHNRINPGWSNHGWHHRDRVTVQYRTPYYPSYSDNYRFDHTRSWPSHYGWREHGWRVDYRVVDPYWFAVITSIAIAQAWSDAQVARAINDDRFRQQMIEDEDIRQQMIASGYPRDQVYYPPQPQRYFESSPTFTRDPVPTTVNPTTPYVTTSAPNPNSPLYGNAPLASGEQIANRNANKNVLFFCHFGNKQQTAEAFRQLQSPDMTVWKNLDSFNKCRAWAVLP